LNSLILMFPPTFKILYLNIYIRRRGIIAGIVFYVNYSKFVRFMFRACRRGLDISMDLLLWTSVILAFLKELITVGLIIPIFLRN